MFISDVSFELVFSSKPTHESIIILKQCNINSSIININFNQILIFWGIFYNIFSSFIIHFNKVNLVKMVCFY
jgi:hypothetical protein